MQDEFPETDVKGLNLKNFKKIAFTLSHNMHYLATQKVWEMEVWAVNKEAVEIGYVGAS